MAEDNVFKKKNLSLYLKAQLIRKNSTTCNTLYSGIGVTREVGTKASKAIGKASKANNSKGK